MANIRPIPNLPCRDLNSNKLRRSSNEERAIPGDLRPLEPDLEPLLELDLEPFPFGDGLLLAFLPAAFSSFLGEGERPFLLFPEGDVFRSSFLPPFFPDLGDPGFPPFVPAFAAFASGSGLGGVSVIGSEGTSGFGSTNNQQNSNAL